MKPLEKLFLLGFCFLLTFSVKAQIGIVNQDAKIKPTLAILGTYHMGTPGNNVVNPKVADISTPERQKQVVELVKKLKNFKPTKIVLECDHPEADAKTQENYDKYLAGNYQLSKNENDQIGFRLAKESGLKKVYCVDWSDFWNDPSVNYIKYAPKDAELDSFLKGINQKLKQEVDAEFAKILPLPITDQLIFMNQPERMEKDHKVYFDIMRIGRGQEYVGAGYFS